MNINFPQGSLPKFWLIGFLITQPLGAMVRGETQRPTLVKVPESVLRKLISKFVMPDYPEGSRERGEQGVAVAEIQVNEAGALTDVRMLEAPSDEIKDAVVNAIRQCKFRSGATDDGPVLMDGKLTFYFVIENGRGTVKNPKKFKS